MLIEKTDTGYESVMDWLLAMLAPSWKKHIKAYYEFRYTTSQSKRTEEAQ